MSSGGVNSAIIFVGGADGARGARREWRCEGSGAGLDPHGCSSGRRCWTIADGQYSIYYSPSHNLEREDAKVIRSAKRSIDAALYSTTDWELCGALAEAANRGVHVRIHPSTGLLVYLQLETHLGIAHEVAVLFSVMGNRKGGLAARSKTDVLDAKGHIWRVLDLDAGPKRVMSSG